LREEGAPPFGPYKGAPLQETKRGFLYRGTPPYCPPPLGRRGNTPKGFLGEKKQKKGAGTIKKFRRGFPFQKEKKRGPTPPKEVKSGK